MSGLKDESLIVQLPRNLIICMGYLRFFIQVQKVKQNALMESIHSQPALHGPNYSIMDTM